MPYFSQFYSPHSQQTLPSSLSFDEAECDLFLPPGSNLLADEDITVVGAPDNSNDNIDDIIDNSDDDDNSDVEILPEMFFVPTEDMEGEGDDEEGIVSSVVPKKMPAMVSSLNRSTQFCSAIF